MSLWSSFQRPPLASEQIAYLSRALAWGREHSVGFESHWDLWQARMSAGKVSVVPAVHRGAEGLYNALSGGLYLSSGRLPLAPKQAAWALSHWQESVVVQGLVDVTAVIVHESTHALAGFWGSLQELQPYLSELAYLRQLATHEPLRDFAQSRVGDLIRDAWECERIRLD